MRSEERAGIVFLAILLLWGTLIAEPFRIFADLLYSGASDGAGLLGLDKAGLLGNTVILLLLAAISVLMLLISRTGAVYYLPCIITATCLAVEIVRVIITRKSPDRITIALAVMAALIGILHILKADFILLWVADLYILSIPVFIFVGCVIMPIASKGGIIKKILYASRYQSADLSSCYNSFLSLPAIVWGIAAVVITLLPSVYYSFYRRKG